MKDKKAAKLIIKRAKKHPEWYTKQEIKYAKLLRKKIKQHTYGLNEAYSEEITHADKYMPISKSETNFDVTFNNYYAPQAETSINEADNSIQSYFDSKVMIEGLKVLAFEQYGAGPFGTQYLSDLGAEVIKVETFKFTSP